LAAAAAVLIGIIANRVALVSASRGVTAWIVSTALLATTVALFVAFDNTVATLLASNSFNIPVVAQAVRPDVVVADSTADVADRARREFIDTALTGRVHDILSVSVTGVRA